MFLDTLSKYIAEKYIKFGEGEIWFGPERVAFNFLPILAGEFLINNEFGREKYPAAIFISARRQGYEDAKQHAIPLVKNWTPAVKIGLEWLNLFGCGTFRTVKFDNKEGFGIVAGRASFGMEVKAERPSIEPVDFVIGALAAGFIQYYMKTPIYAVETSCVAQKDAQECVFVIGNRKNIIEYIQKFSPDKVEWGNKTLDQIEAVEEELRGSEDKRWL